MRAVYAGSFDPVTLGHVSVIERALGLFQEVHVIVANNRAKQHQFTIEQRTELVRLSVEQPNVYIMPFEGIVADYINEQQINVVIRGIRNATDLEYELQLEQYIRHTTKADTVYLSPYTQYMQTSSSLVRMFLLSERMELAQAFMTPEAYRRMVSYADVGHE